MNIYLKTKKRKALLGFSLLRIEATRDESLIHATIFQVRHIKKGINPSSASKIFFSGNYLTAGIRIGVVSGMVALTVYMQILLNMNEFLKFPFFWDM